MPLVPALQNKSPIESPDRIEMTIKALMRGKMHILPVDKPKSVCRDESRTMQSPTSLQKREYYVEVTEWGRRTFISVRAHSSLAAIQIAKLNARNELGWEGVTNIYRAYPTPGIKPMGNGHSSLAEDCCSSVQGWDLNRS